MRTVTVHGFLVAPEFVVHTITGRETIRGLKTKSSEMKFKDSAPSGFEGEMRVSPISHRNYTKMTRHTFGDRLLTSRRVVRATPAVSIRRPSPAYGTCNSTTPVISLVGDQLDETRASALRENRADRPFRSGRCGPSAEGQMSWTPAW